MGRTVNLRRKSQYWKKPASSAAHEFCAASVLHCRTYWWMNLWYTYCTADPPARKGYVALGTEKKSVERANPASPRKVT